MIEAGWKEHSVPFKKSKITICKKYVYFLFAGTGPSIFCWLYCWPHVPALMRASTAMEALFIGGTA